MVDRSKTLLKLTASQKPNPFGSKAEITSSNYEMYVSYSSMRYIRSFISFEKEAQKSTQELFSLPPKQSISPFRLKIKL